MVEDGSIPILHFNKSIISRDRKHVCKDYDIANHSILLAKMTTPDIPNFVLVWCKSFSYEYQTLMYNKNGSTPACLLGPVCLLIHIIPKSMKHVPTLVKVALCKVIEWGEKSKQ